MKLKVHEVKSFSPLEIKIEQFLFVKRLSLLKLFFSVAANTIGFASKTNLLLTSWSCESFFEDQ